jgi:hypothetical protein
MLAEALPLPLDEPLPVNETLPELLPLHEPLPVDETLRELRLGGHSDPPLFKLKGLTG